MRSTKRGQITKMTAISKTVWLVQVLTAFVLHTGAMTTDSVESVTTNSHVSPETRQGLITTTATTAETATAPSSHAVESTAQWIQHLTSTEQPSVRGLHDNQDHIGLTSTAENDQTTSNIHKIIDPGEMTVSSSPTSLSTSSNFPDTRTTPELASQDDLKTTELQKDHSVKATPFLTWTEGGESTSRTDDATSPAFPQAYSRNKTDEMPTSDGSYVTTEQASPASTAAMPITTQTTPNNRTNAVTALAHERNGTDQTEYNNWTLNRVYSTQIPNQSTEETTIPENLHNTTNTTTTDTTGQMGYNYSTPKPVYSTLNPNQSTENVHNMTNITVTDNAVRTESTYIWSTRSSITNTSENISRSDAEWTLWANCADETEDASSKSRRSSKLTCLITLWILGMIASIFLGLTIFLWVRLSIVRKMGQRQKKRKDRDSLWAEPPTDENVEFCYANGATLEADKKRKKPPKVRRKKNGARQTGKEEDMWIQPKVTLEEITEFWSANGRVRNDDRMDRHRDGL